MDLKLDLIDLDQDIAGQRRFISCWLGRSSGLNFIVDPGPPATAGHLLARLESLGVSRLDHIFLTHIHLDHGGATAQILDRWPQAVVHSHRAGHKHLADPGRLWEGSRQVLGRKAEVYGEPRPVPEAAIATDSSQLPQGVTVIQTPGHAPHHLAFLVGGNLFLGEAAGTFSDLGQGPEGLDYYLRPATPPRFFLPVASLSLDRLLALKPMAHRLCFAHHGQHCGDVLGILTDAKEQLHLWLRLIRDYLARKNSGKVPPPGTDQEAILPGLAEILRAADPLFARGKLLPEDIQERESDFTQQTLRGMLGYLASTEE